jgi:sigma-E factor negative regulatory protein RseB
MPGAQTGQRDLARQRRRWVEALLIAGGLSIPLLGAAQEAKREAPRTDAQWISAARSAAQRINYTGTIVYQSGGEITSSRITHVFDGSKSMERIQTLDGKPREYLRKRSDSDDEVQCLIPESRKIIVEKRRGVVPGAVERIARRDPATV